LLQPGLDLEPDRVFDQRPHFLRGLAFGIAALQRRTDREIAAIFIDSMTTVNSYVCMGWESPERQIVSTKAGESGLPAYRAW
jgi:hypothetical protein